MGIEAPAPRRQPAGLGGPKPTATHGPKVEEASRNVTFKAGSAESQVISDTGEIKTRAVDCGRDPVEFCAECRAPEQSLRAEVTATTMTQFTLLSTQGRLPPAAKGIRYQAHKKQPQTPRVSEQLLSEGR